MANIKGWFTMNGMHIPIMEGQSKAEAAQKYMNSKHGKTVSKLASKTYTKKKEQDANNSGEKKILYHQTKVESLDDFDESKRQAGLSDTSTPKGIFLKETNADIGLEGKNQLKMEVTMKKPLEVKDREELKDIVSKNNERYKNIIENEGKTDSYFEKKTNDLEAKWDKAYEKEYSATGKEKEKYKKEADLYEKQLNDTLDQWHNAGKDTAKIAQEEMTKTLKEMGYDSIIIEKDKGSFGRVVKSYVVFDKSQLREIKDKKQNDFKYKSRKKVNGEWIYEY